MKKKNLNFLLALLAALVLVFAGACSDGSDDVNTEETDNSTDGTGGSGDTTTGGSGDTTTGGGTD